jgi:Cu/Ag efflux protein CusF
LPKNSHSVWSEIPKPDQVDNAEIKTKRSPARLANFTTVAEGEVEDLDIESKSITLKHGPIKSKTLDMEPMTMPFAVANLKLLTDVKVRDKVKFSAEYINEVVTITALKIQK